MSGTTIVSILFGVTCVLFIASAVVCLLMSFRFEEKKMDIYNHIKAILRHNKELSNLFKELELEEDEGEWGEEVKEKLSQIHKHAAHIIHTIKDNK